MGADPQALVDKMLTWLRSHRKITLSILPGDGRTVITAAKRGLKHLASNTTRKW